MLLDCSFNSLRIRSIHNIYLLSILKIMKRGYRSNSLALHQFGCIWCSISDHLYTYEGVQYY